MEKIERTPLFSYILFTVTEGGSLYGINQKHVLTLLATTYDGSSPMMIYTYCSPGNLKRWLSSSHQPVNTHQVAPTSRGFYFPE